MLPPYSGTMSTPRRITKDRAFLHILQVEQERTQTNLSKEWNKTKTNTKTPRETTMIVQNSNNQKEDKKIKDEEKTLSMEKNPSWRSYLVEHNTIKEGMEHGAAAPFLQPV